MIKKYMLGLIIVLSFFSKTEATDLKTEASDNDRDKNGTTRVLFYVNGNRVNHFTSPENKEVDSKRSSYFDKIVENTPPQKDKLINSPLAEKDKKNTSSKSPSIPVEGKRRESKFRPSKEEKTFDNIDSQKNNSHTKREHKTEETHKSFSPYQPVSKEKKNDKKLPPRRDENYIFQFDDEEDLNSSVN